MRAKPWRAWILTAGAIIIALAGGYKLSSWRHRHPVITDVAQASRERAILSHASQQKHFGTVVFGDSITELAYIPSLCGDSVLNAGVDGYLLAQSVALLKKLHAMVSADKVILIAGLNDAQMTEPRDLIKFRDDYDTYVHSAEDYGGQVLLGTVGPVAQGMRYGSPFYDTAFIDQINGVIRQTAQSHGLKLVDFNAALSGAAGRLAATDTIDGAHLSTSGYAKWSGVLQASACASNPITSRGSLAQPTR